MKKLNNKGVIHHLTLLLAVLVVVVIASFAGYKVYDSRKNVNAENSNNLLSARGNTCNVKSGALYCWGANFYGQLGIGTKTDSYIPTAVKNMNSGVSSVSANGGSTCSIKSGALYCWGANDSGKLGNGTNIDSTTPTAVSNMSNLTTVVSVGERHACAIRFGALYCWGDNFYGQLGIGTKTNINIPKLVEGMNTGVSSVSAGYDYTCAIKSGALYCWGANDSGQLGNGTITAVLTPKLVTNMGSSVSNVSISQNNPYVKPGENFVSKQLSSTCAIKSGALYCWGANDSGQIGNGTTTTATTPKLVTNMGSSVSRVALGQNHTCAIKSGALYCWGLNNAGQLGNGPSTGSSITLKTTPVLVKVMNSNITNVATGRDYTCAFKSGALYCWGANYNGELGLGDTNKLPIATPTLVKF